MPSTKLDELQVFVQLSTPVVNVTLLAFAADRHAAVRRSVPAAVDRYLLPAGRPAANPLHASAALDKWYIPGRRTDRRTERRTDTRPLHRLHSAYYASSGVKQRLRYDTIRYDTKCYFSVLSKADMS